MGMRTRQTTTYSVTCDACERNAGFCASESEAREMAEEADFSRLHGTSIWHCPDCQERHEEYLARIANEPTEAEIQAALDFGKTAEQHLSGGEYPW